LIIIAIAIAASAAAMVIINIAKIPRQFARIQVLLNATKLILTLFRIISNDISMVIMYDR
jgi:hypothetical protein